MINLKELVKKEKKRKGEVAKKVQGNCKVFVVLAVHQISPVSYMLAPTNVTSDDAHRRQFGMAVFHEPRMNPQVHGIPL